jgi:hypothetical protein
LSSQEASWLHSSTALRILHYSARIILCAQFQILVAALSSMHPHAPLAHIFICLHALLTSPYLYIYCTADHSVSTEPRSERLTTLVYYYFISHSVASPSAQRQNRDSDAHVRCRAATAPAFLSTNLVVLQTWQQLRHAANNISLSKLSLDRNSKCNSQSVSNVIYNYCSGNHAWLHKQNNWIWHLHG